MAASVPYAVSSPSSSAAGGLRCCDVGERWKADLYMVEHPTEIVYTYSPSEDGTVSWRLTRMSPCQRAKVKYVLLYGVSQPSGDGEGWTLQDQSPGEQRRVIGLPEPSRDVSSPYSGFGTPVSSPPPSPGRRGRRDDPRLRPPLGLWRVGRDRCTLTDVMPEHPALEHPISIDVPFATVRYLEEGNIARMYVKMKSVPIADEVLEDLLSRFRQVLLSIARRPRMVLLIRSDGQDAAVPSIRHIRRFLAFIQENGPEFFLVGRGSAIVLRPRGILGNTLVSIVKMVQRLFPSPWPERIVPTTEEAEAWLAELAETFKSEPPVVPPCESAVTVPSVVEDCLASSADPPMKSDWNREATVQENPLDASIVGDSDVRGVTLDGPEASHCNTCVSVCSAFGKKYA